MRRRKLKKRKRLRDKVLAGKAVVGTVINSLSIDIIPCAAFIVDKWVVDESLEIEKRQRLSGWPVWHSECRLKRLEEVSKNNCAVINNIGRQQQHPPQPYTPQPHTPQPRIDGHIECNATKGHSLQSVIDAIPRVIMNERVSADLATGEITIEDIDDN